MRSVQEVSRVPWNHGRMIGPKPPLKPKHIWAIRTRLQHEIAFATLPCSTSRLTASCEVVTSSAFASQTFTSATRSGFGPPSFSWKTGRPVPFELTEPTRDALAAWLRVRGLRASDWLFPSRSRSGDHLTTRQYGRLLDDWVTLIGLDPAAYGTHSLRRTKVALLYKRTGNLRACQLLLGHTKLESTVRYLGIEVDDALILSEQTEL